MEFEIKDSMPDDIPEIYADADGELDNDITFILYGVRLYVSTTFYDILGNAKIGDVSDWDDCSSIRGYKHYGLVHFIKSTYGCKVEVYQDIFDDDDDCAYEELIDCSIFGGNIRDMLWEYYNTVLDEAEDGLSYELQCILDRDFVFIFRRYYKGYLYMKDSDDEYDYDDICVHCKNRSEDCEDGEDYDCWKEKEYGQYIHYIPDVDLCKILKYIVDKEPDNKDAKFALELVSEELRNKQEQED